jgi:AraC-like DNA-binding protein
MQGSATHRDRIAPSGSATSAVAGLIVNECDRDVSLIAIPRPEIHLVVRFGPSARNGLDVHALGGQQRVRRKLIRAGQRTVAARVHFGAAETVLGVPASAIAGRILALDELWGEAATRRLLDRLANARTTLDAATILESAIAERLAVVDARRVKSHLALKATEMLRNSNVNAVAAALGVSERHLRRVFQDTIGMSPKAFAKLDRFHRALHAGREDNRASWAGIAATSGYYDQAHLIDEFRTITGATPSELLSELDKADSNTTDR